MRALTPCQVYLRTHTVGAIPSGMVYMVTPSHRQVALLLREAKGFQDAFGFKNWPCLVAGGECKSQPFECIH
jgi:hypothetical protein